MRHCSHVCASEILFEILFALGGAAGLLLRVGAGCRGCILPRRQPALQLCHGVLVAAHLQAGTRTSGSEPLWNKHRRSTHGLSMQHDRCTGSVQGQGRWHSKRNAVSAMTLHMCMHNP